MKKLHTKALWTMFFAFLTLAMAIQSVSAQTKPFTPEKGSTERKAILDGVRKYRKSPGEIYTPTNFKVQNGWAFISAPDPGDPEIDTMAFDLLLQKTGSNWKVVDRVSHIEGTDYDKEIKRIRKRFPKASAGIFQ